MIALAAAVIDLVVPTTCVGCLAPGFSWCPECAASVIPARGRLELAGGIAGRAAAQHEGQVALAVSAYKDRGRRDLAGPLAEMLTGAVASVLLDAGYDPGDPLWIVPIPARRAAKRKRGGDTLAELARRSARSLRRVGIPAARLQLLRHTRITTDQVGLSGVQRRANVAASLECTGRPDGWIVVVDDVVTTGATISAALHAIGQVRPTRRWGHGCLLAASITVA